MPSFSIAGTAVDVLEWPRPTLRRAIEWEQLGSLNWRGSDRGAAQDEYESVVRVRGVESAINSLQTLLQANREGLTLSAFVVPLFAPNVSHAGSIASTVLSMGPRQHVSFANPTTGYYEMEIAFRALAPTFLGTTPSLASLRPVRGYEADKSYEVGKAFTYAQAGLYSDPNTDIGRYTGTFMQTTAEAQAILAYICTTARAASVSMPTIPGVTYPFGVVRGALPKTCRIKSVEVSRHDLRYWILRIEFVEDI